MTLQYVTSDELALGTNLVLERFGCIVTRRNLEMIGNRLVYNRDMNNMSFPDALRKTLDEYKFTGERRIWYKAALGKMFGSRNKHMHKGKVPKRTRARKGPPREVDKNGQFSLGLS